jgi:hypothetical protein
MNERVFEFAMTGTRYEARGTGASLLTRASYPVPHARVITYAVEIEGEAPLYFSIEAVDE